MASHLGLKKIQCEGNKKQKLLVIVQHMLNNISKNYGPFFRIFENFFFKVWVKFIKIYSYFHLKYIFRPIPYVIPLLCNEDIQI
jgi:hypothetical protein